MLPEAHMPALPESKMARPRVSRRVELVEVGDAIRITTRSRSRNEACLVTVSVAVSEIPDHFHNGHASGSGGTRLLTLVASLAGNYERMQVVNRLEHLRGFGD